MTYTVKVSRKQWTNCFSDAYKKWQTGDIVKEQMLELYGIDRWQKINFDEHQITFLDEKKMIHWLLRWS